MFKVLQLYGVPQVMEIVPKIDRTLRTFCTIVLSTDSGRFCRPVRHRETGCTEWVSPMEQTFLDIAVRDDEMLPETTHIEISPLYMISVLANCTPFSNYNQSCRNMYQCQMLKQTLGTF